jgi:hypothetical protein
MNPFELLWGVDVAIKKLRPGANFALYNNSVTNWEDPSGNSPPTWEEIEQQMNADKKAYNTHYGIVEAEQTVEEIIRGEDDYLPEETSLSKQRMSICQSCDQYAKVIRVCNECYCFMPLKTRLTSVTCPLGKW